MVDVEVEQVVEFAERGVGKVRLSRIWTSSESTVWASLSSALLSRRLYAASLSLAWMAWRVELMKFRMSVRGVFFEVLCTCVLGLITCERRSVPFFFT